MVWLLQNMFDARVRLVVRALWKNTITLPLKRRMDILPFISTSYESLSHLPLLVVFVYKALVVHLDYQAVDGYGEVGYIS